ncbi:MAG: thioredoxin family protein [Alphaproteobacteria bacterium]|nr:thioredoxin family protein [Alphaproteobacteria bacterium]
MKNMLLILALAFATFPAGAGELVMFGFEGCPYCAAWERDVGQHYASTDVAALLPLRRIDIKAERPKGYEKIEGVRLSPTFVIMACKEEVERIQGYRDSGTFWDLMDMAAAKARAREAQAKC